MDEKNSWQEDLLKKDADYVWHPFTQHQTAGEPLLITKANGTLLFDHEGKSFIDANSSWWVNTHGHGHPHISEALLTQFSEIDHIVFAGATHPKAIELSERIVNSLPDSFSKVFFSDNGSTAVEVALKMTFQYWFNKGEQRTRFLAINGSYHGDTFGAMSVGQRGYFNKPFEHFFFDVDFLDFPIENREQEILGSASQLLSTKEFAGIIVEPLVQGAAGMKMYSAHFLDELLFIAKKNNTIVIFDEVMTGFGRTGKMYAMDYCTHKPDIVALSKGLTAGIMPLGLTVASKAIFDSFLSEEPTKALLHGHSFTGNALACAAACASLDLFDQEATWNKIEVITEWHKELKSSLIELDYVQNLRQCGTILAFEIATSEGNDYFSNIRSTAYNYFLSHGVLLRPLGNTIFINPPYCITQREYELLSKVLIDFLISLQK